MKTSFFVGRWQVADLHEGHRGLIQVAIDEGNHVVVGIRDTDLDEGNPFPVYLRHQAIRRAFGDRVDIVVIPDRGCDFEVCIGRKVGYDVRQIDLPPELATVSGTKIRERKRIIWLTGHSGAGKTTLAKELIGPLRAVILDGDEMRDSISLGAGFTVEERLEHNLRVARLAAKLVTQRNVIVSVIAPTQGIRDKIEEIVSPFWVYMKRELPEREGHFYDPPPAPDLTLDVDAMTVEDEMAIVLENLRM